MTSGSVVNIGDSIVVLVVVVWAATDLPSIAMGDALMTLKRRAKSAPSRESFNDKVIVRIKERNRLFGRFRRAARCTR